jgi:hypothetical protein
MIIFPSIVQTLGGSINIKYIKQSKEGNNQLLVPGNFSDDKIHK